MKNILLSIVSIGTIMSYLPQIIKLLKTKKSRDLSIKSWILWLICSISYFLYATTYTYDNMLIFQASLELVFCTTMLYLVIKFKHNN